MAASLHARVIATMKIKEEQDEKQRREINLDLSSQSTSGIIQPAQIKVEGEFLSNLIKEFYLFHKFNASGTMKRSSSPSVNSVKNAKLQHYEGYESYMRDEFSMKKQNLSHAMINQSEMNTNSGSHMRQRPDPDGKFYKSFDNLFINLNF